MDKFRILLSQMFITFFGKKTKLINDEYFNRFLYFLRTGRKANLDNPNTFNENILYRKIFYDEHGLSLYTDKYEVRKYVEDKIGKEYVVPIFGVWNSVKDIDFSVLPQKFVLKSTHGSGWNVVVKDRFNTDLSKELKRLQKTLTCNYYYRSREKNYRDIIPRILCESLLETINPKGLIDFKSYCYYGKTEFFEVTYIENGRVHQSLFYRDLSNLGMINGHLDVQVDELIREKKDIIIDLSEKLAQDFDFVRVDFYIADDDIYFSELTFHSGGGIRPIKPESVDRKMGSFFKKEERI